MRHTGGVLLKAALEASCSLSLDEFCVEDCKNFKNVNKGMYVPSNAGSNVALSLTIILSLRYPIQGYESLFKV